MLLCYTNGGLLAIHGLAVYVYEITKLQNRMIRKILGTFKTMYTDSGYGNRITYFTSQSSINNEKSKIRNSIIDNS